MPENSQTVVGALVRDQAVILSKLSTRLHDEGSKRRASFIAPRGLVRAGDLLHLVVEGDAVRVIALHVNRRIRRRADVDGDLIDARVMGDLDS